MPVPKLNRRIRALREVAGLTQQALADAVSVTKAAVSSWECGKSQPTAGHLPRIAAFLGVEVSDLYESAEERGH